MPRLLLPQVLLLACCRAAAGLDRKRGVATWYDASDLDTSLRELQENAKHFASVSLFKFGNSSSTADQKAAWMKEVTATLGIETYLLVGGGVDSFYTSTARATTVARFAAEVANGSYTGVDLDYEHLPLHNESITQAYSKFVRALSSTFVCKGYSAYLGDFIGFSIAIGVNNFHNIFHLCTIQVNLNQAL